MSLHPLDCHSRSEHCIEPGLGCRSAVGTQYYSWRRCLKVVSARVASSYNFHIQKAPVPSQTDPVFVYLQRPH